MLWSLLKNAEWKPFLELLSPSFFEVLPARLLLSQAKKLSGNYFDTAAFAAARASRAEALGASGLPIRLEPSLPSTAAMATDGDSVLALYFHQVLSPQTVLLDHRSTAFRQDERGLIWAPSPVFAQFELAFSSALAEMYHGFYEGDEARFSRGANALGLGKVEGVLRNQFGVGDQSAVRFSVREFQGRFQDIFRACKAARVQMHPDFVALGIGLATLYEHLEKLGGIFDVRAAFQRAVSLRTVRPPLTAS